MSISRFAAGASLGALCLMLAACGGGGVNSTPTPTPGTGGGGGTPTPTPGTGGGTPTPTPSTGANDDLLAPLASESFKTQGISSSAKYSTNGGFVNNPTTSKLPITFSYDASSKSYSISVGGRTQTFHEADIDNANSTAQVVVYVKKSAEKVESLTLTRAGTSGAFTYQFVGGGFWERATLSSSTITASLDSFTYGAETGASSVPRTGGAAYDISLVGVHPTSIGVEAFAGTGSFDVDFARGTFALRGDMSGSAMPVTEFVGDGRLSSSVNGFSGEIRFNANGRLNLGTLDGKFYGPSAQELGGVWQASPSGSNPASGTDSLYTGVILGRKDGALSTPTSFAGLNSNAFISGTGALIQKNGSSTPNTRGNLPVTVHYDAATGVYSVFDPDRSYYTASQYGFINEVDASPGDNPTIEAFSISDSLDYVRAGTWSRRQYRNGLPNYRMEALVFGFPTAGANVPRTGSGQYDIDIGATILKSGASTEPSGFRGEGLFLANFATGGITLSGELGGYLGTGGFQGTGSIASNANAFNGSISISSPSDGEFTGSFNGAFYGPNAQELGATMVGTGSQGQFAGSFVGSKTGSIPPGAVPLSDYTEPMKTRDLYNGGIVFPRGGIIQGDVDLLWNPSADTYRFTWGNSENIDVTFGAAQRDAGASNNKFDVFNADSTYSDVRLRVYKTGNSEVALSYTSFVEIRVFTKDNGGGAPDGQMFYYGLLGTPTPRHQMPQYGSATYSGVAYGAGVYLANSNDTYGTLYTLTGTSKLSLNFQTLDMTGSLSLTGAAEGGGSKNFGTTALTGNLAADASVFNVRNPTHSQAITGYFFGPNAAEFAATFNIRYDDAGGYATLTGATIGKKD